ncbi:hypothetical protein ACP275_04G091400 [Erythranthe tilingii]
MKNASSNFDYQEDFTQFLEEARKKACKWPSNEEELDDGENKRTKKTWKKSFFSWLKSSKSTTAFPKAIRRGHASGPVGGGRAAASSGPIAALFSSTRSVEEYDELPPYTCLDHHHQLNSNSNSNNNNRKLRSYGPVYFVT